MPKLQTHAVILAALLFPAFAIASHDAGAKNVQNLIARFEPSRQDAQQVKLPAQHFALPNKHEIPHHPHKARYEVIPIPAFTPPQRPESKAPKLVGDTPSSVPQTGAKNPFGAASQPERKYTLPSRREGTLYRNLHHQQDDARFDLYERNQQILMYRQAAFPKIMQAFTVGRDPLAVQRLDKPSSTLFNIRHASVGAIAKLRDELNAVNSIAILASEYTPYIYQGGRDLDGSWGCGYRNLQMMLWSIYALEALGRTNRHHHDALLQILSNIPKGKFDHKAIRSRLETAWAAGFDPDPKRVPQLLLGPSDISAILGSLSIKTQVRQFDMDHDGLHRSLFQFAFTYFTEAAEHDPDPARARRPWPSTLVLNRPPLYLQTDHHSRSIVGVERAQDGTEYLLIFDPIHPVKNIEDWAHFHVLPNVRVSLEHLSGATKGYVIPYYQVVTVGLSDYSVGEVRTADKFVDDTV